MAKWKSSKWLEAGARAIAGENEILGVRTGK